MASNSGVEPVETGGNDYAESRRLSKSDHLACLQAAVESFLAARRMSRDGLAEDLCGLSLSNFSKVMTGVQGDFLGLLDRLPGEIRADYEERIERLRCRVDPVLIACERLIADAFAVLSAYREGRRFEQVTRPDRADRRSA